MTDYQQFPNQQGYFGDYGGVYLPETLMGAIDELTKAYETFRRDESCLARTKRRPVPL